jgi:hypothetical protein
VGDFEVAIEATDADADELIEIAEQLERVVIECLWSNNPCPCETGRDRRSRSRRHRQNTGETPPMHPEDPIVWFFDIRSVR